MHPDALEDFGGSLPHNNLGPYLSVSFFMCINEAGCSGIILISFNHIISPLTLYLLLSSSLSLGTHTICENGGQLGGGQCECGKFGDDCTCSIPPPFGLPDIRCLNREWDIKCTNDLSDNNDPSSATVTTFSIKQDRIVLDGCNYIISSQTTLESHWINTTSSASSDVPSISYGSITNQNGNITISSGAELNMIFWSEPALGTTIDLLNASNSLIGQFARIALTLMVNTSQQTLPPTCTLGLTPVYSATTLTLVVECTTIPLTTKEAEASNTDEETSNSNGNSNSNSNSNKTVSIAIGVAVGGGIILVGSAVGIAFFTGKRRRKNQSNRLQTDDSENAKKDENHPYDENILLESMKTTNYASLPLDRDSFQKSDVRTSAITKSWQIDYKDIAVERELGRGSYGIVYLGKWRTQAVAGTSIYNINQSSTIIYSILFVP